MAFLIASRRLLPPTARYAPKFSETSFWKIHNGTSAATVRNLIGEPLTVMTNSAPSPYMWWLYSEPRATWLPRRTIERTIVFSNNVVVDKLTLIN